MIESNVSHAEVKVLCDDKTAQLYRKRNASAKDEIVINGYLRDFRNSHMVEDEEPVTADDIDLSGVDKKYYARIRKILQKHEKMWSGHLGKVEVTEQNIELVP